MFDSGYISRGLALIASLRRLGVDDPIWVLCLDPGTKSYLDSLNLPSVITMSVFELECTVAGLAETRSGRSNVEYFFTCTSALATSVLAISKPGSWTVYLDADMAFHAPPNHLFADVDAYDIGIVPHRFPNRLRGLEKYGHYNVAWVMLRNSTTGRACAEWWRDRCIDWCFDHPDGGRYADQGYLDEFPSRFPGTVVLEDPGINVAPWNLGRHEISEGPNGALLVDGRPLVFYHFHGLRKKGDWIYPNLATYKADLTRVVRDRIYRPYIAELDAIERGASPINLGNPVPAPPQSAPTRNQRSFRSAAYRARRRLVQYRERRSGGAFRIDDIDDEGMASRRYG